ncbi:MAG: alpha/beta hydrolase [Clostridia bacterium]|nr:alpha/beta hydrolase [Clostridia bacterium]
MKTKTKIILGAAGTLAATYGVCTLMDEMLFNKKLIMPPEINAKFSGCDMSHLGELLANNLRWVEEYGYEKHYITSDRGEKLTGYLMRAEEPSDIYVFGAHGYRSYGKKEFCGFAQYYLGRGVNIFFPDHIASGESEGTHCTFGYYEKEDCMKWLSYMKENFGEDIKIILHGVSMGSATVCMMSGRDDLPENVKFTVADCGFTTAKALFASKMKGLGIPDYGLLKAVNCVHKINHGFDFREIAPVESVKTAKVPMLFVHGREDNLVPAYMAGELYDSCGSEYKDILIVENADHAQSHVDGKQEYEDKIDEFIEKFVE